MKRRFLIAAIAALLPCAATATAALAGQGALADAQRDYNSGKYNRAVDALNSSISKSPNDASLLALLGESYYQLREYSRAAASFEHAIQVSPKVSEYHDWLGKAYGRRAEESMFLGAMSNNWSETIARNPSMPMCSLRRLVPKYQ